MQIVEYFLLCSVSSKTEEDAQASTELRPASREKASGSTELGSDPIRPSSLQVWFVLRGRERERALTPDSLTGRVLDKKVNQKTDKETPARVMDRRSKQEANCYESHPVVQRFR